MAEMTKEDDPYFPELTAENVASFEARVRRINFHKHELLSFIAAAGRTLDERDRLKATREVGLDCERCLGHNWIPCKEGDPGAIQSRSASVSSWWTCGYCYYQSQLSQAQAALVQASKSYDNGYKQGLEDGHRCEQRHAEIDALESQVGWLKEELHKSQTFINDTMGAGSGDYESLIADLAQSQARGDKFSLLAHDLGCELEQAQATIEMLRNDVAMLRDESSRRQTSYNELIMAVGKKYPDEDRHATALRYIRTAEERGCSPACVATEAQRAIEGAGEEVGK